MGFLKNTWVNYFDRTYQQIKDSVLTRLGAKVPEMTDHTENNPYVVELDIFAGISEMLGYNIDNQGRESFIDSARLYKSAISLARLLDYKVIGNLPYTANVQFSVNNPAPSPVTIPAGTMLSTGDGIPYTTQAVATIPTGALVSNFVAASQYVTVTGQLLGTSTGTANMIVTFSSDKVVHNSISVLVGSTAWSSVDTFGFSKPDSEVFVQNVDAAKRVILMFGNGMSGAIPAAGEDITADYKVTLGANGGAMAGTISTITSSVTVPGGLTLSVTNPMAASGGQDVESLSQLKDHIPLAQRTQNRAVTQQDYEDILRMAPGVDAAGVVFNCGKTISAYITPDGGGEASSALIASTLTYINYRKMITTKVNIFAAGNLQLLVTINVNAQSSAVNTEVEAAVRANVLAAMSSENQSINGRVFVSDIYEAVEGTPSVLNSEVIKFVPVPYARPLNSTTPVLDWTREIRALSMETVKWRIVFISGSDFQVLRAGTLIGTYPVGVQVLLTEIRFTVNAGTYSSGDQWEFVTYPYTTSQLILQEPSIPTLIDANLIINVTGGL